MHTTDSLNDATRALGDLGLIPGCSAPFRSRQDQILESTLTATLAEVAEYSESRNPDILPDLRRDLADHLAQVAGLLCGEKFAPEFISEQAQRKAEQHFPLDAVLRAYRCLSLTLSEQVRDAAIAVAPDDAELRRVVAATANFAGAYASVAAGWATRRYVEATRRLAEVAGDRKKQLLNLLLDGYDESEPRAAALLRSSGYLEQRQTYAVIAIRAAQAAEMDDAERVERIQSSLKELLQKTRVRVVSGQREGNVIAVISATRRLSGWTRPHTLASDLVLEPMRLMGNAVLVGISDDVPSTSHVPRAWREAELALDHAHRGHRVVRFSDIRLLDLLIERACRDGTPPRPGWLEAFHTADRHGRLSKTLNAYADNNMNVIRTAQELGMHANSIYARFARIEEITGLSPQHFHALNDLLLALRLNSG